MSRSGISKRCSLGRRGTTSVEMALVASTLIMMLFGSVEIGRYYYVSESVKYLAGELARAAIVNPDASHWSSASAKAPYVSRSPILNLEDFTTLDVAVNKLAAPAATTVTVTAVYPYRFKLAWLPTSNLTINSRIRLDFLVP